MKRGLAWSLAAVFALAAIGLTAARPSEDDWQAPYPVAGTVGHAVGHAVEGRRIQITVDGATFADRLNEDRAEPWSAEGNWLVVRVTGQAVQTEVDAQLGRVRLVVGERVFIASERPRSTMVGVDLRVDVDTTGVVVFDLPPDVRRGPAVLQFASARRIPVADSLLEVPLDLTALDRTDEETVTEPDVGGGR